jgi:hypothetical protein
MRFVIFLNPPQSPFTKGGGKKSPSIPLYERGKKENPPRSFFTKGEEGNPHRALGERGETEHCLEPSYETSYEIPPDPNSESSTGGLKALNVEHRTSNIERRILMTLRFIDLKTNKLQNTEQ